MSNEPGRAMPEFVDGGGRPVPPRILATLNAVCPHHFGVMKRWHLIEQPDGSRLVWSDMPTRREAIIDGESGLDPTGTFLQRAPASYDAPEGHHWREVVVCPRPSCSVRVELRLSEFQAHLRACLVGLAGAGVPEVDVSGIDRDPTAWRIEPRA